ncbi:putative ribose-phosphate diphosphokinase [Helianthus annuus]|uniref:Ribose-phosphate diphosphokinase n=1 Tax=Helianthus annuus TaxID=4232 RepID=A0A9K3DTF2_HELAN|nr:putative ribose-phosphate diphosphokinase [Helianthus annuus]KAJ0822180.1 putative ribose-phosphate diphosphokinase [Helianthus annuus]
MNLIGDVKGKVAVIVDDMINIVGEIFFLLPLVSLYMAIIMLILWIVFVFICTITKAVALLHRVV